MDIDSVTEIDITVLTATDLYMAKVVVQHGATLVDESIEMICCEYIAFWVEEYRGRCKLRVLWNLKYGHYT
jgi:hypothetical protein